MNDSGFHILKRILWGIALLCFIGLQGWFIYHRVFDSWQGPVGTLGKESLLPAVLIGAGRGFAVVDIDAVPELRAFLNYETTSFDADAIPDDAALEYPNLVYQWHRYVLYTVGYTWRIFGISWGGVAGIILGMLLASSMAVYGISRLALPVWLSIFVTLAFTWNQAIFSTMPLFRDFSKAPFILVTVFLLARVIRRPSSWKNYLATAVLIGLVLGVGMGFRRDMAALVPLSMLVLFTCRLKPVRYAHAFRPAAALLLALTFTLCSFPILASFYPMRWTNAHDLTMGLSSRCEQEMGTLTPASYEKHYQLHDGYTTWQVHAAARHRISISEEAFQRVKNLDANSQSNAIIQAYLRTIIRLFPADILTRAYAATLRCIVGIRSSFIPFALVFESFGLIFVFCGLVSIAAVNPWQAWQTLLLLCLFCGSTSLQFGMRHAFHTSFVPYWFGCFCLYNMVVLVKKHKRKDAGCLEKSALFPAVLRVLVWLAISFLAFYMPLKVTRWIQYGQVNGILGSYQSATRIPLEHTTIPKWTGETLIVPVDKTPCKPCDDVFEFPYFRQRVLVARFKESPTPLDLKLAYEWHTSVWAFCGPLWSHTRPGTATGGVDVFFTVYEAVACGMWNRFAGLLMPEEQADLFVDFQEVEDLDSLGFYFNITIPANMEAFEYYQGLRIPFPNASPIQYPWPMEDYLYQNDEEIMRCLRAGETTRAMDLTEETLQERPRSVHFSALLAQSLFQKNRDEEAWKLIEEMLRDYPKDYALYQRLDMLFGDIDKVEGQYAGWQQIVEAHPQDDCAMSYFKKAQAAHKESNSRQDYSGQGI